MDYFIAIRSYNRAHEIQYKTLKLLDDYNIDKSKICIFVANELEYIIYKHLIPREKYGHLIIGEHGISNITRFISNYFPNNYPIVCMDDDISQILKLNESGELSPIMNLKEIIELGFSLCKKYNKNIWGVYPTPNPYFMKDSISTDIKFIIGTFYGIFNQKVIENKIDIDLKEDYKRSIEYGIQDNGVIRLNNISFNSIIGKKGGINLNLEERLENNKKISNILLNEYPGLVRLNPKREGEILLNSTLSLPIDDKSVPENKVFEIVDIENLEQLIIDLDKLINLLKINPLPWNKKRKNSGEGYTQTYGIVNKRSRGYGNSSNNIINPEIWECIKEIAKKYINIDWVGCQLNYNYKTKEHKDKNNFGNSCIIGFGNYSGGELVIENTPVDIDYKLCLFDGSKYTHYTRPFIGNRYSIVFFNIELSKITNIKIEQKNINIIGDNDITICPRRKSWMWKYYNTIRTDIPDIYNVTCTICGHVIIWKSKNGSSGLNKHMKKHSEIIKS